MLDQDAAGAPVFHSECHRSSAKENINVAGGLVEEGVRIRSAPSTYQPGAD